ncbi:MAG: acyl-CoA thioesterase [Acinetobacter sp. 39-4]|nr:MAG: acyl-CoA thioesterase [Acinetobacter sp. 39-4]OJU95584.1 MAG: acyl-CoA thioesterase [Acinetobacter sp. 38-8]
MTTLTEIIRNFSPTELYSTPSSWLQGRTTYGGLSAALSLQAVLKLAPSELPPLRTAQFSFVGPVANDITFDTQVLRQGKSATSVAVDCYSAGQIALRSTLFFGHGRQSNVCHELTARPQVSTPDDYGQPLDDTFLPSFFGNFDVRFTNGVTPVSSAETPELIAWVKLKDVVGIDPQVVLLAIGDCLPPAAMACFTSPAPISSMNWTVDFINSTKNIGGWFLLRSRSLNASHGYSHQVMEIWDEDGNLIMLSTQTVAIFA